MKKIGLVLALVVGLVLVGGQHRQAVASANPIFIQGCVYNPDGTKYTGTPGVMIYLLEGDNGSIEPRTGGYLFAGAVNNTSYTFDTSVETGCYTIRQLPNQTFSTGNYILKTQDMGQFPGFWKTHMSQFFSVTVTNASTPTTADIHLLDPIKNVSGVVTDANGNPAANQVVEVDQLRSDLSGIVNNSVNWVRTNPDGTYQFPVAPGSGFYGVWSDGDGTNFMASGFWPAHNEQVVRFDDTSSETRTVNFQLQRISANTILKGKIVDDKGGVSDEMVAVAQSIYGDGQQFGVAQSDGTFSMPLAAGTYRVYISYLHGPKTGTKYLWYSDYRVTMNDGKTVNLGTIRPSSVQTTTGGQCVNCPPTIIVDGQNAVATADSNKVVKKVEFTETFATKTYLDLNQSNHVTISGAAKFKAAGISTSSMVTASSMPQTGTLVSKPFSPRGVKVTSVTLLDFLTWQERLPFQYSVSADGVHWMRIQPNVRTDIPAGWDTTSGLRWKVDVISLAKAVTLPQVQLAYNASATAKKPVVTNMSAKRSGSTRVVTISGVNFTKGMGVYIGGTKVSGVKVANSKTLQVAITSKSFKSRYYSVTVISPQLQSATAKKKVNPVLVTVK